MLFDRERYFRKLLQVKSETHVAAITHDLEKKSQYRREVLSIMGDPAFINILSPSLFT